MIWVVLAALGVPLWLVVGALGISVWSRWQFLRRPEVFACRLRSAGPTEQASGWSRGKRHAYWAHDVLLVHHGLALQRYDVLRIADVAGPPVRSTTAKGLGDQPMWIRLHLDDDGQVDLATHSEDVAAATGPFVTASLT